MSLIKQIFAREILDSRGLPTVECLLWLDSGQYVVSSVPAGTSKGKYEALELRDGDPSRMNGLGVKQAVNNINTLIAPQLIGQDPNQQLEIDQLMVNLDGTPNKSKLGANAILAVSQAVTKAAAISNGLPIYSYLTQKYQLTNTPTIPNCIYGLINGGEHGADNLDIQEFQIIPASFVEFSRSLEMAVTVFHKLEEILVTKGAIHSVGLAGGFAPNLYNNTDAFEILIETTKATPFTFAQDLFFGVDMEAQTLFTGGKYSLKDRSQAFSPEELLEYYKKLRQQYHVFYIEDPFVEDDEHSWQAITNELGGTTLLAADNLTCTNQDRLTQAITAGTGNTLIVKPNQTGTVSETIDVIKQAKQANWQVVISHRSGETADDFIADLAVGTGADYAKFGPPNRGERVSKYNRLLLIEQQLNRS